MSDSLLSAQSIVWMLRKVLTNTGFRYEDWKAQFREDSRGKDLRGDRKFFNHLRLFNTEVLPLFPGLSGYRLKGSHGRYFLKRSLSPAELGKMMDKDYVNFMPLLHGLNDDRSLVPFPQNAIEKQLIEGLDINSETLGRIVYKHTFPWRFQPEFVNAFLDALHRKTQLFIRPEHGRKPCAVTPLFLVNYEGSWHLLGLHAGALLQYSLSRVLEIKTTDEPAEIVPPRKVAALKALIQSSFGINLITDWSDLSEGEPVTVRYFSLAARYARERFDPAHRQDGDPWFEVADHGDCVDVTLKVQVRHEILSEVLRWGPDAEALSPQSFREDWIDRVRETAEKVAALEE